MSDDHERPGPERELPLNLLADLLRTVPRFVDRTRNQAEFAASLAGHLPCLGSLFGAVADDEDEVAEVEGAEVAAPNDHERVPIDVLSVLDADPSAAPDALSSNGSTAAEPAGRVEGPVPDEADLPIPDYDSLAAAHVVPRLATMTDDELLEVRRYELAHRNRRTILNRIAQRLDA